MANAYKLTFITDTNKSVSLSVGNPDTTLSDAEVQEAMEKMIEADAVFYSEGKLKSVDSAELVTVTQTELAL